MPQQWPIPVTCYPLYFPFHPSPNHSMKLAILSREPKSYSTQRLVEAAAARGHEAVVVDHLQCNLVL